MAQRRKDKRKAEESAGGNLKRFMVTKSSDLALDPADHGREKCQRIEDISTIEDAWDVVRVNKEIPTELKKRVGQVREFDSRKGIRPLQITYCIRKHYKNGKQLIEESFQWQRYEIQRHVVAELESLPTSPVVPEASASNGSSSSVGSNNGSAAEFVAPRPNDAEYRFQVTPRTVEDLAESMRGERSRAFTPWGKTWQVHPWGCG